MNSRKDLPRLRGEGRGGVRPSSRLRDLLRWSLLAVLGVGALGAAGLAFLFWHYGADASLPRIMNMRDYKPKQVTRILAADGKVIGEIYEERRTYVPLEKISKDLVAAVIDAEDAEFRHHEGLDFTGMVRAAWVNLRSGETRQGASTITQQVVKTFLLTPEKTFRRKMQEIILARRLESTLNKDEILTLYLNQIYFGHGRYGVEEAARFYFGKGAADLDVGEAAMLAGLPQSPERLSPFKHADAAKSRQIYVLEQMAKHGHLEPKEAERFIQAPIAVVKSADANLTAAPELVEIVKKELVERHGAESMATLGMTVKTTLDLEMQAAAREALEKGLEELDARQGYRGAAAKLSEAKATAKLKALTKTLGSKPREGQIYEGVVRSVSDADGEMIVDLGGWQGAAILRGHAVHRYVKEGEKPSARFAKNDLVRVRVAPELGTPRSAGAKGALALELGPQGAMVVLDPVTRHVLALVGGYDFGPGQFDRAMRAKRQPGSAFKPLLYAAALDSGQYTTASIINDAPEVYDLWKPKNSHAAQFRGPIRLREALALSINTVAIRVLNDVGVDRVIELSKAMGFDGELPRELSIALGSGVVTPLALVNTYATFAAGGLYAPPVFFTAVGPDAVAPPQTQQVLRPEIAYLATALMTSVVEEGTGVAAKKLKRPISGKTGTSNDGRDAWFVGYTPELLAGVWVGFDDMKPLGKKEEGAKAALPIWIQFMQAALKGKSSRPFRQPPGIVVARIDRLTGKLAQPGEAVGDTLEEVFLDGTAPTEFAPAPGEVDPATFMMNEMEEGATPAAPGATPPAPGTKPPVGKPIKPGARVGDEEAATTSN